MNGAVFGVYSYLSEYLENITMMTWNTISLMLLIYGGANIVGNILAGKLLTKNAITSVVIFPFALGAIYVILFLLGRFSVPMYLIILLWGILAGIGANINQYWITSTARGSQFANGIFLTSTNLGTTIGATVCGLFISRLGIQYVVFGEFCFWF